MMEVIGLDALVRAWIEADIEPSVDGLATAVSQCQVDAGWRTDEELVLLDDSRMDGTVFGTPFLSSLSDQEASVALAAITRLLLARGEIVLDDSGEARVLGPVALIDSFLRQVDRQATVEARREDQTRTLVFHRAGELSLIEEVLADGLHHFVFVSRLDELQALIDLASDDADWGASPLELIERTSSDPMLVAMLEEVQGASSTATLISRITRKAVLEGIVDGPELAMTLYAGTAGCVSFEGFEGDVVMRGISRDGIRGHLADVLG